MKMSRLDEETEDKITDAIIAFLRDKGQWAVIGLQHDVPHSHEDGRAIITVSWISSQEERS